MNIQEFITHVESLFDEVPQGSILEETRFKDIDEWSSLLALSVIAIVDEECNYRLTANDFNNSVTIKDLYNKIRHE